jgi:hypothetical protein
MRFPPNFTKENKITFYTQRKKEMVKQFNKFSKLNKIEHSNKLKKEIEICEVELLNLNK